MNARVLSPLSTCIARAPPFPGLLLHAALVTFPQGSILSHMQIRRRSKTRACNAQPSWGGKLALMNETVKVRPWHAPSRQGGAARPGPLTKDMEGTGGKCRH
ncbi:hypothetical protein E2C01_092023 [Portunus trituberculatus]|uniref:Uncharacterized protein n=1 Tax=Portunus trituberculatus TaxID=210409 RepID=A0A5B7JUD9_PORTR|nr:hypothetical protein [Portunus trituberculatus]